MKLTFGLLNGGLVEWPVPAEIAATFSFPVLCQSIRANGYFQHDSVYIPGAVIAFIGLAREGAEGVAWAQGTATKQ